MTRCDLLWPGGYLAISACCSVVFRANHVKIGTRTKQNTEIILLLSKVVQFRDQEGAVVTRCDQMQQNCIFGIACPTGVQDHSFLPPWHARTEFCNFLWPSCDQVWPDAANLYLWNCLSYSGPRPLILTAFYSRTDFHNFVWPASDHVWTDSKIDYNLAPAGSRYPNIQHCNLFWLP